MKVIDSYEGISFLPKWIDRVQAGEEIVIELRDRKTGVRLVLVPLEEELPPLPERVGGQLEGQIWIAPDFDELPEDMAKDIQQVVNFAGSRELHLGRPEDESHQ